MVKKFLKWTGFVAAGLAGLVLVAVALVYVVSQSAFTHRYTAAAQRAVALPTDAAAITEGAHLATIHGCTSCHGERLEGAVVFDIPHVARLVGPNISGAAARYTAAQLATVIQQGIKPDGTSVWIMPSSMYRHLSDDDLARILAYVRSMPAVEGTHEVSEYRLGVRVIIALGKVKSSAQEVAELATEPARGDMADALSHGRYLVMSSCTECHGQNLEGSELAQAPPLIVVKGYSPADFTTLMQKGIGMGGRKLELMREASLARYAHFTAQELNDVYAFLHSR
jgi:cytochrome c553